MFFEKYFNNYLLKICVYFVRFCTNPPPFNDNLDNLVQPFIIPHSTFCIKKNGSPVPEEAVLL